MACSRLAGWVVTMVLLLIGVTAGRSAAVMVFPMCAMCAGCPEGVAACAVVNNPTELDAFEQTCQSTLGCSIGPPCVAGTCVGVAGCPLSEAGQCADGVDNDANGLIDAADPACRVQAPALAWPALGSAAILLVGFGTYRQQRARRRGHAGLNR